MIELEKYKLFNKEVSEQLANIIRTQSFANSYIFHGAKGMGKKRIALQFIKEIFKQNSSIENVEERITNKNHPDLLVIEPSSFLESKSSRGSVPERTKKIGTETIKIGQIRNIKNFLSKKSINSEKKIVLIVDAHLLNEAASNCLLKTLEEPSNGIFILLTSKINLLLDTIISRSQILRFRSFSSKQIKSILKEYLDSSNLEIYRELEFQDLINSANGSPDQLMKNIEIWNELSDEITSKIFTPIKNNLEILEFSKSIVEQLDINKQIYLVNLIQIIWWRKTKNSNLVRKLENLKLFIRDNIQIRLAWETTFLKILMEDL